MNCPICGGQVADSSSFCVHCGGSIAPQTQETVTQEPVAQTQYQQAPVSNNYASDFFDMVRQYIEIAGSILSPAIVGIVLSSVLPIAGQIVGFVMLGKVNSKLSILPVIDEATIDPSILGDYRSARGKVITARILSIITKIQSIVMLIFWILYFTYIVFFSFLAILAEM